MNALQNESLIKSLNQREIEILGLISDGLSNHEIAQKLYLADSTIKWYNRQIFMKLGVNSRTQASSLFRQLSLSESSAPFPAKHEIHPQNNLPFPLTNFIGRENEIDQVKGLFTPSSPQEDRGPYQQVRLVTLTGTGGVGKSRLAVQVGYGLLDIFPHGVWLVELAPLANPDLVPQVLITLFGLLDDPRRPAWRVLGDYLREKKALLILDNCEHLVEACAPLVEHLLVQCPDLCVLATSRETLGIKGEMALKVPSLSLPAAGNPVLESIIQSEAVRLFLDRAAAALPGFVLTEGNAQAIVRVCRRLDGIPLSIELAATRVRLLQVEQIANRLDDAFRLLTGGSRTALARHQTLRGTIDWSYNLLSEDERGLLQRLSVFTGGGRLEAVEAVCSGGDLEISAVLELLTQLVDKSLVMAERSQGETPRYYLLETIRQYATEKLNETGEGEALRRRHARWYAELAEIAEPKIFGHGQVEWLERLEQEHDNFRSALAWSLQNDQELGLRTAGALAFFWHLRGHYVEGSRHLEKLLGAGPYDRSLLHARALTWAAWLVGFAHVNERSTALASASLSMSRELGYLEGQALSNLALANQLFYYGDYVQALAFAEASLALYERVRSGWGIRHALSVLGYIALVQGKNEQAHTYFQDSLALSREIGDVDGISWSLYLLGNLATIWGDFEKAMTDYQESLLLAEEVKNKPLISWIHALMGNAIIRLGDPVQGKVFLEESAVRMRELGDFSFLSGVLSRLGRQARLQGEYDRATKFYSESLSMAWKSERRDSAAWSIAGLAELNALYGQAHKAARLLAVVQDLPQIDGYPWQFLFADWPGERNQFLETIRAQLDELTFQVEQALGRNMSLADAVAYAMEGIAPFTPLSR